MLGIAPESPASGARFVGKNWGKKTHCLKTETLPFSDLILRAPQIFTSPTLFWKLSLTYQKPERRTCGNPCRKLTLLKSYFARKNEHDKKA